MARRGEEVERARRACTVERFELLDWDPPFGEFEVICSKGTYVRTLAHDLGSELGTGASLEDLTRTAVGPYTVDDALAADEISRLSRAEPLGRAHDPALALPDWPAITVSGEEARAVAHGSWRDPSRRAPGEGSYRVLDEGGRLLALARGGQEVRLLRVFAEAESS
jgi:tRNA pseudouridine55 synthase